MSFEPTTFFENWRAWNKSLLRRSVTTFGLIILALAFAESLWLVADRPVSSPPFLVAIAVTAWVCGFRSSVVSAVICGVIIDYFFVQPFHEFTGSVDEMVRLIIFVFEGTVISWLVERLRRAGDEIRAKNLELRALTDYQQRVREEEQKRIAREVHDELGQSLTGLKMNMHLLKGQLAKARSDATIEGGIDDLMEMTDSTIATVRRIASELRPSLLDDFGLVSAVEWQTQEFERRTSIPCSFTANCDSVDLGPERNTAMYRVVQEALTNVARHANAGSVDVRLTSRASNVQISVQDDGVGIDPAASRARSLGLIGMQERSRMIGGDLEIDGSALNGTLVTLTVPLKTTGGNGNGSHKED